MERYMELKERMIIRVVPWDSEVIYSILVDKS
jgi:hypothetical protein